MNGKRNEQSSYDQMQLHYIARAIQERVDGLESIESAGVETGSSATAVTFQWIRILNGTKDQAHL